MQEALLKIRCFERGLLSIKNVKKVTRFFPLQQVPFYGQDYEKQKGPGTSF